MNQSLSTKLSLIAALTMFLCTMTTVAVFLIGNFQQSVAAEQTRLQSIASVFGAVLSKPVAAHDAMATRDALRALRDLPLILQVTVRDLEGSLLAEMGGGAVLERSVLRSDEVTTFDLFDMETLEFKRPLIDGGEAVGTLELTADISWMREVFWNRLFKAGIFALCAISVGFVMARQLVRRATKPLASLAGALTGIGNTETLAYNFKRKSDDEVGVLIDAFNDMMGRIDDRDKSLRAYSDSLEDTVQKRTAELVTARDEAERANAAKSEFLSMMSHEIRTPMNGMMVMAQMLAAAPLSPRHLRFAEIINRSGQNLLAIINDVLDISKIEAGRLEMENSPFSLDQLFADVYGLFAERSRERNVFFGYAIDPSVPQTLIGDPTRINQIITNLVNNALKFTESGSVIMRAKAQKSDAGYQLLISVSDTGIGISPDKLDLVFDRFSQADQSITRRFGGTGLGLAISKRLAEAMHGTIAVESVEGKGSTFTAALQLGAETLTKAIVPASEIRVHVSCNPPQQSQLLCEALGKHGITLVDAESASIIMTDDTDITSRSTQTTIHLVPALELAESSFRTRGRLEFGLPAGREEILKLVDAASKGDFNCFRNLVRAQDMSRSYEEFRGLRALAVDDNNVNREVLAEALTSMGVHVDAAINGEDALHRVDENAYDIIFMDCSMPVMDGFTATRILREREKGTGVHTPVVAITALTEGMGDRDWRASGMDGWISKPFTIPSVAGRISSLVLKHGSNANTAPGNAESGMFADLPLLDEPTMAMIARLSGGETSAPGKRIHSLFSSSAASALAALNSAVANGDHERQVESAQSLKSVSRSAGAYRLAAVAEQLELQTKSGRSIDTQQLETLSDLFQKSERELVSRLGLGFVPQLKAG